MDTLHFFRQGKTRGIKYFIPGGSKWKRCKEEMTLEWAIIADEDGKFVA